MRLKWLSLDDQDRASARTAIAFLEGRLSKRETIEWALGIPSNDKVRRTAVQELLSHREGSDLKEPWLTAWRLIEECWDNPIRSNQASVEALSLQRRLRAGDRTGSLIAAIVDLVDPVLKIEKRTRDDGALSLISRKRPRLENLLHASLTSPGPVDPNALHVRDINDISFLVQLANALDASVYKGMDIARRIGWDGEKRLWRLGSLYRVEYVSKNNEGPDTDIDRYHDGIAPAVKLLHAVVRRISELNFSACKTFVQHWKNAGDPIHLRLWASLSKNQLCTPANEVEEALLTLNENQFWDLHSFPELIELRAVRFDEISAQSQLALCKRIRKGLPRSQWPKGISPDKIKNAQLYWAVRELKRIEIAGSKLPKSAHEWLAKNIGSFQDLVAMDAIDEGFLTISSGRWIPPDPDAKFDLLVGEERLEALEAALSSARVDWGNDPAERAGDWMRTPGNPERILQDFQSAAVVGRYPLTWDRFGWSHTPGTQPDIEDINNNVREVGEQVITMLLSLHLEAARQAIEGISHWLSTWSKVVIESNHFLPIWEKFWPIAVEVTNSSVENPEAIELNIVAPPTNDSDPMDLDTLNTAAGRLVGVFLEACPRLVEGAENPFEHNLVLVRMREDLIVTDGRSGLIAKHRLIEGLSYFLAADKDWTRDHLIAALSANESSALALWRAIARRTQFFKVLEIIGLQLVERVTDKRLGRDTRTSLLSSLVVESLHAFLQKRDPAVPYSRIQQAIRSVEDEIRASAAQMIRRFLGDMASGRLPDGTTLTAETVFRSAVLPFLQRVWPQERSLSTPGVSGALADVPATAQGAFVEAVDAIERFLVPFDCWSMSDYGFWGESEGQKRLFAINNRAKGAAFIRLLDATIGSADGSTVPMDLGEALERVHEVGPDLAASPAFRRLATLARRR